MNEPKDNEEIIQEGLDRLYGEPIDNSKGWAERFDLIYDKWNYTRGGAYNDIKSFISKTLQEQSRDHEILVNTILETHKEQRIRDREEILKRVDEGKLSKTVGNMAGDYIFVYDLKRILNEKEGHNPS